MINKLIKFLAICSIAMLFIACYVAFPKSWSDRQNEAIKVLRDAGYTIYDTEQQFHKLSAWNREIYLNWVYLKMGDNKARIFYYSGDADKLSLIVTFTKGCGCSIANGELRHIYGCWTECSAHNESKWIAPFQDEKY